MKYKGVEPDVISYSAAISACEKGGQWEDALGLYREAYVSGVHNHWDGNRENRLIDFHSYPVDVAKVALRMVLREYLVTRPRQGLRVIVGVGNHTEGKTMLKPGLLKMLATEFTTLKVEDTEAGNAGRIIISPGASRGSAAISRAEM